MLTRTLAAVFALALFAAAPSAARQDRWVTVSPESAGFSVEMPGQPKKTVGEGVTAYTYSEADGTDRRLFMAVFIAKEDAPEKDPESILKSHIRGYLMSVGKTKDACKVIDAQGLNYTEGGSGRKLYPGIMAKAECDDGTRLTVADVLVGSASI